jgi:hypothetical protein
MNTQTNTIGYTVIIYVKKEVIVLWRNLTETEANEKRIYCTNGGEEARVISDKTAEIMCY